MTCILSLDQGTTGSRALIIDQDGTILGQAYREFPQHFPQPGWVEHDAEDLFRSTLDSAREALARSGARPAGIGITNQRETIVLWDRKTLRAVAPAIVWQDRRTAVRDRDFPGCRRGPQALAHVGERVVGDPMALDMGSAP